MKVYQHIEFFIADSTEELNEKIKKLNFNNQKIVSILEYKKEQGHARSPFLGGNDILTEKITMYALVEEVIN